MDAVPCPTCGSKRTTEITPTTNQPRAIWCHQCGSVSERRQDEWPLAVDEDDPVYAIWVPRR